MSFGTSLFSARRNVRQARRGKELRGTRRRLFETLETRCVLSCTAMMDPLKGTLVVMGDSGANKVAVQDSSIEGITVTCDGSVFKAAPARHISVSTLGGPDTFEVNLGDAEIDPNNPNLRVLPTGLNLNLDGGKGADVFLIGLLNVAIDGDLDLTAEGGDGDDAFDAKLQNVQLLGQTGPETSPHIRLHGGSGADAFLIGMLNVAAPAGAAALHLDVNGAAGNDAVTAMVQDSSIDAHLDFNLGAGQDTFAADILPDSNPSQASTDQASSDQASNDLLAVGCIEANVNGDTGADTFLVNVGQKNSSDAGNPRLSSELMLNFNGGGGADSYLIGLLNVAIGSDLDITATGGDGKDAFSANLENVDFSGQAKADTDAHVTLNGGGGANSFLIGLLNVASPDDAALHVNVAAGGGNDDATAHVQGNFIDLHLDVNLGAGKDTFTANILPDSDAQASGGIPGGGCIEANLNGDIGADTFLVNVGQQEGAATGNPSLSSELMLNFDGGDGNDVFLTSFANVTGNTVWKTTVNGDDGNDTLISSFSNVTADYSVAADLGAGNDSALISIIGPEINDNDGAPRSIDIDVFGGSGRDSLFLSFLGELIGPMDVVLDGGEGNDAIDAVFMLARSPEYFLGVEVRGGKANDNMSLLVFGADKSDLLDLLLDASEGRDKYHVTDNVTVQKV